MCVATMHYIATLEHSPEHCWAREDHEEKAREWIRSMDRRAEELGIELHGAYATPNEHEFYFVLEADGFEAVTEFLGPPLLQDHDGHVSPVLTLEEARDSLLEE